LLQYFLLSPKKRKIYDNNNDIYENIDFLGRSPAERSLLAHEISDADIKTTTNDNFMVNYYIDHPEDFNNPLYNLKGVEISKYIKRPHIPVGPCGIIYYISNKSCNILINHLNNIKFNIFHYDEYTDSYPYTIEDCAVSYILYYNKISFIHWVNMYHDYPYNNNDVLAIHTNMNK
jgi:hypothetical protein